MPQIKHLLPPLILSFLSMMSLVIRGHFYEVFLVDGEETQILILVCLSPMPQSRWHSTEETLSGPMKKFVSSLSDRGFELNSLTGVKLQKIAMKRESQKTASATQGRGRWSSPPSLGGCHLGSFASPLPYPTPRIEEVTRTLVCLLRWGVRSPRFVWTPHPARLASSAAARG